MIFKSTLSHIMESYSALVPVKNGINHLPRLQSYFNTIPDNFEIVIIDDNSSDGTSSFLDQWRKNDDRITVIWGPGKGIVQALNLGLNMIKSDWIFRFDVDDIYRTERIATQLSMVTKPNMVACFSDYEIISENMQNMGYMSSPVGPSATYLSLISANRTAHPSAMIRREALLAAGGYLDDDFPCEDLALWLRLKKMGDLFSSPVPLMQWRLSSSSLTTLNRTKMRSKKSQLIHEFFDFDEAANIFLQDSESVIESYRNLSYGAERKLLYLLDFYKLNKIRNTNTSKHIPFIARNVLNFGNIDAISNLTYYKMKRSLARSRQARSSNSQLASIQGE